MKTLTKQKCLDIIDRFADKGKVKEISDEYPFKPLLTGSGVYCYKEVNLPVMLTDVLDKIIIKGEPMFLFLHKDSHAFTIISLWRDCVTEEEKKQGKTGFKKDLLTIMNESGFEEMHICECGKIFTGSIPRKDSCWKKHCYKKYVHLKSPALELFTFLDKLK
jgi:hypothetical protein